MLLCLFQLLLKFLGILSPVAAGICENILSSKAPPSAKFFVWMTLLARCWTLKRLQRHGLQNSGQCALCSQASELIDHLLLNCVYAREVWFALIRRAGFQQLCPVLEISLAEWWLRRRKEARADCRKGFDSLVILVTWHLRKERNARIFDGLSRNAVCSSPSSSMRVEPGSLQVSLLWQTSCHDLCVRLGQAKGSIAVRMMCFLRFRVCCNLGLWLSLPLNEILAGWRVLKKRTYQALVFALFWTGSNVFKLDSVSIKTIFSSMLFEI
jgi:hypothetical protein